MNYINDLRKNVFFRHVATLTLGTFLAQVINLIITPFLARLYSPVDYASFAIFTSVVTQIAIVASLRLEFALPTIEDDCEANQLTRLTLRLATIISLISFFSIIVYLYIFSSGHNEIVLLLAPLAIFLTSVMQVLNFYSTRNKSYSLNSLSRVFLSLVTCITSILFGCLGWASNGLIIGTLTGLFSGVFIMFIPQFKKIYSSNTSYSKKFNDSYFFKKFRQFILINTPHAFIDTLELSGILLLMNRCYSESDIGSYFFAYRILQLPVSLIGSSVFQVLYQRLSEAKNSGYPISPIIKSIYLKMAIVGLPIFLIIFQFASDIFKIAFGEKWLISGYFASIMAPWLFFNFIASSVSSVSMILDRQQSAILIAILNTSLRLGSLYFLGTFLDFPDMIGLITTISSFIMIYAAWWYYHVARKYELNLIKS